MKHNTDKKSQRDKVLIVVRGGVVQDVYSSNANTEVDLLDYDNELYPSDELASKDFDERRANLKTVL